MRPARAVASYPCSCYLPVQSLSTREAANSCLSSRVDFLPCPSRAAGVHDAARSHLAPLVEPERVLLVLGLHGADEEHDRGQEGRDADGRLGPQVHAPGALAASRTELRHGTTADSPEPSEMPRVWGSGFGVSPVRGLPAEPVDAQQ